MTLREIRGKIREDGPYRWRCLQLARMLKGFSLLVGLCRVLCLWAGILGGLFLGLLPAGLGPKAVAEMGVVQGGATSELVFSLQGPNDGETLDGRAVPLTLTTNYTRAGSISVYAGGMFVASQPYFAIKGREPAELVTTAITVDLEAASQTLGRDLLSPDDGPLVLTVRLYNQETGRLVAYQTWHLAIPAPWLEFITASAGQGEEGSGRGASLTNLGGVDSDDLPGESLDEVETLLPTRVSEAVVHVLPRDSYFVVAASQNRELLTLSPGDPRLFKEAMLLAGDSCSAEAEESEPRILSLESWRRAVGTAQAYLVVWTYDGIQDRWHRSLIYRTQ